MSDDDSSELSSVPSDNEAEEIELKQQPDGILRFFHAVPKADSEKQQREATPPPRKRSPSPPHVSQFEDNPDIAFIVMFRARFNPVFPKSLSQFGPQELERDITDSPPGDRIEHFLCALLGLVLNRKQDVKSGHYGRALEDAILTHKAQWPRAWEEQSPVAGGATFNSMTPTERLTLLRALALWSLSSSDAVRALITQSFKQNRQEDDRNQPLSVQPWGSDGYKRRYFLVEGLDDTAFRVYRESNPAGVDRTWWSVAGSIEELKVLADRLVARDGGPKARKLSTQILAALPRFEAGEDKRRKREYRIQRKRQFTRPEAGFSLYEGRTRGKRAKYTFSDDENDFASDSTNRRSTRNTRGHTPAEGLTTTTASGRQVRPPRDRFGAAEAISGGSAAGSVHDDAAEDQQSTADEMIVATSGRPRRSAATAHGANGWSGASSTRSRGRSNVADDDDDEEGTDFDGDDENDEDEHVPEESEEEEEEDDYDEAEAMVEDDLEDRVMQNQSRVVKMKVAPAALKVVLTMTPPLSTPEKVDRPKAADDDESDSVDMPDAPPVESATSSGTVPPAQQNYTPASSAGRHSTPDHMEKKALAQQPATPSGVGLTPLAFRGSPEKAPLQSHRTIDVGVQP